jgi:hypothetical protein
MRTSPLFGSVETYASVTTNSRIYLLIQLVQAVFLVEASELRAGRCNAKKYRGSGCIRIIGGSVTLLQPIHALQSLTQSTRLNPLCILLRSARFEDIDFMLSRATAQVASPLLFTSEPRVQSEPSQYGNVVYTVTLG